MTASKMVSVALSQVGYAETGVNHTKYGAWFGLQDEWCDIFVCWCGDQAGELAAIGGKHAATGDHVAWFKAHGQWGTKPKVGAIVFFDWPNTPKGANHVGIVVEVHSGYIVTVEGNEGNAVRKVKRSAYIMGYGYPKYAPEPAPTPKPVPSYPGKAIRLTSPYMHGTAVHVVQTYLKKNGYSVTLDSVYGPKSYAAVRSFQSKHALTVDGVVGPLTWVKLVK